MRIYPFSSLFDEAGDTSSGGGAALADAPAAEDSGDIDFMEAAQAVLPGPGQSPVKEPADKQPAAPAEDGSPKKPAEGESKGAEDDGQTDADKILAAALGRKPKEPEKTEPKPGEKPAEGAPTENPEDKLELGPRSTPEAKEQFKTVKGIAKQLRSEVASLQSKVKELEARPAQGAPNPEVEKLRTELKAAHDRLAIVDVRAHPDFVKTFTAPRTKAIENLNGILKDHNIEGVDFNSILSKPRSEFGKAVGEIAAKLPEFDRADFMAGMRGLRGLAEGEAAALANAGEAAKNFNAQRQAVARSSFDAAWKQMGDRVGFTPLQPGEKATPEDKAAIEAYNADIAQIRPNAERMAFNPANEAEVATVATKAATYDFLVKHGLPRLEAEYKRAVDLIRQQHTELSKLRGSKGEAAAAGGSAPAGGSSDQGDIDYAAEARRYFKR
jgi:hypothetical protein